MTAEKILALKRRAAQLRKVALTMIYEAQSGHPGGSLSAADFVAALYFSEMRIDPKNPKWEDRDRFVLSKGHVCPIQYAALGVLGYFPEEQLHTLRKEGSILQGHPDMKKCPGIDISTGSLGQGFACGAGMALAAKRDGKDYRVFVVIGDGESQEGEIWEAAQVCNKDQLDNLVVFCDYNNLQLDGTCDEVMPVLDLSKKFEAFGFETYDINGNSMEEIVAALDEVPFEKGKPNAIVAHTTKGCGVPSVSNNPKYHATMWSEELVAQSLKELDVYKF